MSVHLVAVYPEITRPIGTQCRKSYYCYLFFKFQYKVGYMTLTYSVNITVYCLHCGKYKQGSDCCSLQVMASRMRGLSNEEIQRLLFDDNDSDDDISEMDIDDNLSSSSSVDNNNDGDASDASDATFLYSVDSSQYVWSDTDTFDRSPLQFTHILTILMTILMQTC